MEGPLVDYCLCYYSGTVVCVTEPWRSRYHSFTTVDFGPWHYMDRIDHLMVGPSESFPACGLMVGPSAYGEILFRCPAATWHAGPGHRRGASPADRSPRRRRSPLTAGSSA